MPKLKPTTTSQKSQSEELLAGLEFQRQNRLDEAELLFKAALTKDPASWRALHQLGAIALAREDYSGALKHLAAAMKGNPASAEVTSNYGVVLRNLKRDHEAIEYFNRALMLKPGYVPAVLSRGTSLHYLGRRSEALASFERVIEIDPDNAKAHYNRANVLHELKRFEDAFQSFSRAADLEPQNADIHWNEALSRLLAGDFRRGLEKYEWRWKRTKAKTRNFAQSLWLGEEPLQNKTILVHAEQGYGDTLQCARYFPLLRERGAKVVLEAQSVLRPVLEAMDAVSEFIEQGGALPAIDFHCPVMSLPLAFRTDIATIPANVPYVKVPADRLEKWRELLPPKSTPRIAIAWSGSATHEHDHIRSIPIETLGPLFEQTGIEWLSIQRELRDGDLNVLKEHAAVRHLGDALNDFGDTAAIVSDCDLVISVDTSVVHLAGALNRPVWVLLQHMPDFRWLLGRSDSPWYPSARLFRQPQFGDWNAVIGELREAIKRLSHTS